MSPPGEKRSGPRVVAITGAAGGFGRVFVRSFLAAGYCVAALDVEPERLALLDKEGGCERLLLLPTDIGQREQCDAAVAAVAERFGSLDVLINNAAIGMSSISTDHLSRPIPIEEIEPDIWDAFVRVNFSASWYMTRAALPHMKRAGWGRILHVTTNLSTMLRPGFHPYGPAKAGMEAMAAGHAGEFAPFGITVNVLVPGGPSDTPMVPKEAGLDRSALVPAEAMAPPALWLCTAEAGDVTGLRIVARDWNACKSPRDSLAQSSAPIGWKALIE